MVNGVCGIVSACGIALKGAYMLYMVCMHRTHDKVTIKWLIITAIKAQQQLSKR